MIYLGNHTKNKCGLKLISFKAPLKERLVKLTVRNIHTGRTNQLGYYLAGLIEGDVSIILRQGKR